MRYNVKRNPLLKKKMKTRQTDWVHILFMHTHRFFIWISLLMYTFFLCLIYRRRLPWRNFEISTRITIIIIEKNWIEIGRLSIKNRTNSKYVEKRKRKRKRKHKLRKRKKKRFWCISLDSLNYFESNKKISKHIWRGGVYILILNNWTHGNFYLFH